MAIRPDTDPKSASPRSGTPKGELEQYGVWVKAEPQDIVEEVAAPAAGDMDFDLPGDSTSLPEESFLSEDEEKLLESFDSDFEIPASPLGEESGPLPDIEDLPPLEESLLSAEPAPLIEDIGSGGIDISLEDIESSRPASPIHPGAEIDMDSVEGLDAINSFDGSPSGAIEDVSSEFLDLADEPGSGSESRETSVGVAFDSELDDVTSEFLDAEDEAPLPREAAPLTDLEPLDIDLQFDDSVAQAGPFTDPKSEAGFETVTDFDDFLSADEPGANSPDEVSIEDFDDVSAVERDLSTIEPEVARTSDSPAYPVDDHEEKAESANLSNELLLKIAQELASIRGELVSLKSQIGEAMLSSEPVHPKAIEPAAAEDDESGPSGGFFDEEEDETIALTGDELDNILNTADFTEEIAETEHIADDIPSPPSDDLLDESLLPESGDYSSIDSLPNDSFTLDTPPPRSEPAIEEIRLGEIDSVDDIGIEPLETENLDLVAEDGLMPMTPAPDDTSYLEGAETLDLGAPLNDGPLIEPDLSEFDLEPEELEESRLEIDEELPLAPPEPEAEELTLGIEAGPGYAAEESIADAELLEPVQEIEEPNFAEINLHEEDLEVSASSEPADLEEIEFLPESEFNAGFASEPLQGPIEKQPFPEEEDLVLAAEEEELPASKAAPKASPPTGPKVDDGDRLKSEIKSVLSYLDKLLDSLPEDKIEEFARSEYFDTYKKLFEELGLV